MNVVFKPGTPADASPPRPATTRIINGKGLKHRRGTVYQRTRLAADCVYGAALLRPSIEQACLLFAVPRRLLVRYLRARNGNGGSADLRKRETLAEHIARSSSVERIEAARAIGIDVVWDEMIAPIVSEDRASAHNQAA
jgi:hypothetical protein